jgi:hypothetical protein
VDLARDVPPRDTYVVAPAANLVARADLHPSVVALLMRAVFAEHERGGMLARPGQFPSTDFIEWPLHPAAREYFRGGPPFLQRYLPFWVAALIDRMKFLLLPLVTLLLPLMRIAPPLYAWRVRSRIYRWYRVLRGVDERLRQEARAERAGRLPPAEREAELRHDRALLRGLEAELADVNVPLSYMFEYYNLRLHVEMVARRLDERAARPPLSSQPTHDA